MASLGYGLWQVYPPAAWITEGLILLAVALIPTFRGS